MRKIFFGGLLSLLVLIVFLLIRGNQAQSAAFGTIIAQNISQNNIQQKIQKGSKQNSKRNSKKNSKKNSKQKIQSHPKYWHYHWQDCIAGQPLEGIAAFRQKFEQVAASDPSAGTIDKPFNPPGQKNRNLVWFYQKLPDQIYPDAILYINNADQMLRLYLENKLIYEYGPWEQVTAQNCLTKKVSSFAGFGWHFIPLQGMDYAGKKLYAQVYSQHMNIGLFDGVTLGSRFDIALAMFFSDGQKVIFGFVYLFIALFLFIFNFFQKEKAHHFSFTFFILNVSLYLLLRTQIKYFIVSNRLFLTYAELYMMFLLPVGLTAYTRYLFSQNKISKYLLNFLWMFHLVFAHFALFLSLAGVVSILSFQFPFQIIAMVDIILWLFFSARSAFRGNMQGKIFLAGLLIFFVVSIYDVLGVMGVFAWQVNLLQLGVFALILSLIIVQLREYLQMHWQLKQYSGQLEDKNTQLTEALKAKDELLLLRRELNMARQVQQSLLPKEVPSSQKINIEARYIPSQEVGGDLYDFLIVEQENKTVKDKGIGIFIADVSGHGVPSALIASMLKSSLARQKEYARQPATLLEKLNQELFNKSDKFFVTAAYLYIDEDCRKVKYARAGHTPLIIYNRDSQNIHEYLPSGKALAWLPNIRIEEQTIKLNSGDRLFLNTDGVMEAMDQRNEIWGEDNMRSFVQQTGLLAASEFADALIDQLSSWSGMNIAKAGLEDDITFLVMDIV